MFLATTVLFWFMTPPPAFDIDTRSYPIGVDTAIEFDMIATDGTRATYTLNILRGSTPESVATAVRVCFDPPHWQAKKVSDTVVRARGTDKAPMLFLTLKSKEWAPDVCRADGK